MTFSVKLRTACLSYRKGESTSTRNRSRNKLRKYLLKIYGWKSSKFFTTTKYPRTVLKFLNKGISMFRTMPAT